MLAIFDNHLISKLLLLNKTTSKNTKIKQNKKKRREENIGYLLVSKRPKESKQTNANDYYILFENEKNKIQEDKKNEKRKIFAFEEENC